MPQTGDRSNVQGRVFADLLFGLFASERETGDRSIVANSDFRPSECELPESLESLTPPFAG